MNRKLQESIDRAQEKREQIRLEEERRIAARQSVQDALFELPRAPPKVRKPPDTSRLPKYEIDPDSEPFVCRGKRCRAKVRWGWTDSGKETVLNMDGSNHHITCVDRGDFRK